MPRPSRKQQILETLAQELQLLLQKGYTRVLFRGELQYIEEVLESKDKLLKKILADLDPADVDEIAFGVNLPGSDRSIARQVAIKAGIPPEKVAYTVDRACCSSMAARGRATAMATTATTSGSPTAAMP